MSAGFCRGCRTDGPSRDLRDGLCAGCRMARGIDPIPDDLMEPAPPPEVLRRMIVVEEPAQRFEVFVRVAVKGEAPATMRVEDVYARDGREALRMARKVYGRLAQVRGIAAEAR